MAPALQADRPGLFSKRLERGRQVFGLPLLRGGRKRVRQGLPDVGATGDAAGGH